MHGEVSGSKLELHVGLAAGDIVAFNVGSTVRSVTRQVFIIAGMPLQEMSKAEELSNRGEVICETLSVSIRVSRVQEEARDLICSCSFLGVWAVPASGG